MRDDVRLILEQQYQKTIRWQTKNQIVVDMTFKEYATLWSPYRIKVIGEKLDKGNLEAYLRDPVRKPVTGWINREARDSGVMTIHNSKIMTAHQSKIMFGVKKGDRLSPETIAKMRKPKDPSPEAKARRAAGQKARRERERGNK